VRGGGFSWVGTAALSARRWRTSQGQRRERRQSEDGCVLCSITALTWEGREGDEREGTKWFNVGWVLKSLREKVVKYVKVLPP